MMQFELLEMKTTVSNWVSPLYEINSRLNIAKARISELQDIAIETIQNKTQGGKRVK